MKIMRNILFSKRLKHFLIFAMGLFLLVSTTFLFCSRYYGMVVAKYDAWRGNYAILVYGMPGFFEKEYAQELKRYGVSHIRIAGCVANYQLRQYADGYNSVMFEKMYRKYGLRLDR